ncbi:MAG: inositol 2-dehydrogenase [Bacillota bacterium]|nr:MAG: inositol 2-dehydrogenase [Bacillota bacterium]
MEGKMERVQVGVIGVGRMGARHARNLAGSVSGARLVALADPDRVARERLREELGVQYSFDDWRELVHLNEVDAVVIATPVEIREEIVRECVAAGKHIFSEKPAAKDLATTRRIRELLAGGKVKYQLGFMRRFDPGYAYAYEQIRSGRIGVPVLIRLTSRDASGPPLSYVRTSGGLFVDSSVHDFDLARWLMDDEVATVYAAGGLFVYHQYAEAGDIDTGVVTLQFQRGGLGVHDNTRHSGFGYDIRTEVLGTNGCIQIGYFQRHPVVVLQNGHGSHDCVADFLERFRDAYLAEMQHFVDCLRTGREPSVGVEDGEKSLEIALAARESLRTGKPVAVGAVADDALGLPAAGEGVA